MEVSPPKSFFYYFFEGINKNMENEQNIELDCAPFHPRPNELLPIVLLGTTLTVKDASSKICGSWLFDYSDIDEMVWKNAQPVLKRNIIQLYNEGRIRFGSW